MTTQTITVICFSPTATTRTLAVATAKSTGLAYIVHDITRPENRTAPLVVTGPTILAAPVYYGRVQAIAANFFSQLTGNGAPAALLVNYGNRHYDDALIELRVSAATAGFTPVAAAAFVSQHSLSTQAYPIATGRPDSNDLQAACDFGRRLAPLLLSPDSTPLNVPGNTPYKAYPSSFRAPVSTDACTLCGLCINACPVSAIHSAGGALHTGPACISCQACVAICPESARHDTAPGAIEGRQRISGLTRERREPELFFQGCS